MGGRVFGFQQLAALRRGLATLLAVAGLASSAHAQTVVGVSPDTTLSLGAADLVAVDHAVVLDNQTGIVVASGIGAIPESTDLIGLARTLGGASLLSFDTTIALPGGLVVRPGDVVAWDGVSHTRLVDATSVGIPHGVRTDAISLAPDGLLLSFDTDVLLPGDLAVADEDLVRFDGTTFALVFDGSALGLSSALDVDAAEDRGGNAFVLSFDTHGRIGNVDFADEDLLLFERGVFTRIIDGSVADPDWVASDLDAVQVPEPSGGAVAAALAFVLLARARQRSRTRRSGPAVSRRPCPSISKEPSMRAVFLCVSVLCLTFARSADASDGVLEINQTCAVSSGCFSGDTAGFPVTIDGSAGRSYVLTSDLEVDDAGTDGIFISTARVSIDLNGFAMTGPTVCSGTPTTCSPTGSGSGIRAGLFTDGTFREVAVSNGAVHGFGLYGLFLREAAHVQNVRVTSNGATGIGVDLHSVVDGCVVEQNGDDGIKALGANVVTRTTASLNGGRGIYSGPGSTVIGNSVRDNGSIGIVGGGGLPGAMGTLVADNSVRENGGDGIFMASGGTARGNTVTLNADDGIDGGDGTLILENTIVDNGDAAGDDGIECDAGCAIRGNVVRSSEGFGLNLGAGSAYTGNTITANTGGTAVGGVARSENYCDGAAAPNCP